MIGLSVVVSLVLRLGRFRLCGIGRGGGVVVIVGFMFGWVRVLMCVVIWCLGLRFRRWLMG